MFCDPSSRLIRLGFVVGLALLPAATRGETSTQPASKCMAEAPSRRVLTNVSASTVATHAPETIAKASAKAPAGMVWIAGGEFWMGSEEAMFPDADRKSTGLNSSHPSISYAVF